MTTVAIQGELGAFSHEAALRLLGEPEHVLACRTFEDLFDAVVSGHADLGIVPVENTLAGSVQRAMDLLVEHPLHAVGETRVPIRLCLAAPPDTELADLRTVASHPVALQQCLRFFRAHPHLAPAAAYDTAGSVKELMEGGAAWDAAVGSALAARLYGAEILAENIEDHEHNYTRFLAVARDPAPVPEAGAKTSLAFVLGNTPGSLYQALGCFARHDVDLSRIESRPIPGRPWEYRFFVDARGAAPEAQEHAAEELRGVVNDVRVLGCYAEAP
ncbi:MAG TPA: prephenate dehydratase [Longimicrobiales bacterium]|nr:prephenate dehydratase [Longimicrobiales bacterium]